MSLSKVRRTLREVLRGEDVKITRAPPGLIVNDVRVRCKVRERGSLVRKIRALA